MSAIEAMKDLATQAAIEHIKKKSIKSLVLGVGAGVTTKNFIKKLGQIKGQIKGALASSSETEQMLKDIGIEILGLGDIRKIDIYVDGADQINRYCEMIKGLGDSVAIAREKILANASDEFIAVVDEYKYVSTLGEGKPIPIEVIPMARSFVGRELVSMGANPAYRMDFITDNGNIILDAHDLNIGIPVDTENMLKRIPGVLESGIFANRVADLVFIGTDKGVKKIIPGQGIL